MKEADNRASSQGRGLNHRSGGNWKYGWKNSSEGSVGSAVPTKEAGRLLIYAHYYVPDTASTGQILKELAEGLLDAFDVTVICVAPSYLGTVEDRYKTRRFYREELNGVKLLRVRVPEFDKTKGMSRIRNILSYFFGAIAATFKVGRQDCVLSISQPPILGGLLGVWGKWVKRAKFIYNIQDFNPEQVRAVGYSGNRALLEFMMWLDKLSCRQSDLVVTVGRDLVETLEGRFKGRNVPKYALIHNWIDEKEIYPLPQDDGKVLAFKHRYGLEDKFVIMYSGNIGLYYDLEGLIRVIGQFEGAATPDGRKVAFAFVGAGSVLDKLIAYAREQGMGNVRFIPYQNKTDLIYSLNAGDVHLCVNARGIKGVSCPSKFYGLAAAGRPMIGILEEGTEVRCLIEETGCGRCVSPMAYDEIGETIAWFIERAGSEEVHAMGRQGREYLAENLTKAISVGKYRDALMSLQAIDRRGGMANGESG